MFLTYALLELADDMFKVAFFVCDAAVVHSTATPDAAGVRSGQRTRTTGQQPVRVTGMRS